MSEISKTSLKQELFGFLLGVPICELNLDFVVCGC